jgi:hypothetical protein
MAAVAAVKNTKKITYLTKYDIISKGISSSSREIVLIIKQF